MWKLCFCVLSEFISSFFLPSLLLLTAANSAALWSTVYSLYYMCVCVCFPFHPFRLLSIRNLYFLIFILTSNSSSILFHYSVVLSSSSSCIVTAYHYIPQNDKFYMITLSDNNGDNNMRIISYIAFTWQFFLCAYVNICMWHVSIPTHTHTCTQSHSLSTDLSYQSSSLLKSSETFPHKCQNADEKCYCHSTLFFFFVFVSMEFVFMSRITSCAYKMAMQRQWATMTTALVVSRSVHLWRLTEMLARSHQAKLSLIHETVFSFLLRSLTRSM